MKAFEMLMTMDVPISYQTPRTIETRFNELEMELDQLLDARREEGLWLATDESRKQRTININVRQKGNILIASEVMA